MKMKDSGNAFIQTVRFTSHSWCLLFDAFAVFGIFQSHSIIQTEPVSNHPQISPFWILYVSPISLASIVQFLSVSFPSVIPLLKLEITWIVNYCPDSLFILFPLPFPMPCLQNGPGILHSKNSVFWVYETARCRQREYLSPPAWLTSRPL